MKTGREGRAWRRGRWLLLGLFALVLSLAVFRTWVGTQATNDVQAIRDRGLPTSELELDRWYKSVPVDENAALLFLEAAAEHVIPTKGMDPEESKEQVTPGKPLPPKLAASVAAYVSRNETSLQKLTEARELSASRYPVDYTRGFATLLPHLAQVKRLSSLLKWVAIQKSAEGKTDEAVQSLLDGFALAASLEAEPTVISQLVRIACVAVLLKGMEPVVNDREMTDEQLRALSTAVLRAEEHGRKSMLRGLAGERAIAIPVFNFGYRQFTSMTQLTPTGYELEDALKMSVFGLRRILGMNQRDLRFYLDATGKLEQAAGLDFPEMLPALKKISDEVDTELAEHRWKYAVSGMLLPSLPNNARKEALLSARLRCTAMALAIERFRLRNAGKLPRLDQLIPDFLEKLPTDPVDRSPLEYHLNDGKGYRVLAAASTELSNEGRKPTNRQDITFTVIR